MQSYHSVTLDKDKCKGCTNCIKNCPTEAIRVRNGKAEIISERCIDCGECIRICPHKAKKAGYDSIEMLEQFRYTVALPAPSFYAQFPKIRDINVILTALKYIGFDDVFEVALAAQAISAHTRRVMEKGAGARKPVISSACPAVVKLIRIRFPELVGQVLPAMAPVELAARLARRQAAEKTGLKPSEIGVFFISPCPAKISVSKTPIGFEKPMIDGVLAMSEVYQKVMTVVHNIKTPEKLAKADFSGIGWAASGGEGKGLNREPNTIEADGIGNVIKVLEEVEDGKLDNMDFIELNACMTGCLGGCLTVENPFVARARLKSLQEYTQKAERPFDCPGEDMSWSARWPIPPFSSWTTTGSRPSGK